MSGSSWRHSISDRDLLREAAAARLPAHDSEAHPAATARRLRLGQVAGPSGRQADSFMIASVLALARRPGGLAAAAGGLAARAAGTVLAASARPGTGSALAALA